MQEYIRICPVCNKNIICKTYSGYYNGISNNRKCKSCGQKEKPKKYGKDNPFYGKKHTKETREKIRQSSLGKKESKETCQKKSIASSGKNNPMYGKSVYSIWISKYGKLEADKKLKKYKRLQSKLNSGSKNNAYGKPANQKSGNGWKGWYKNIFFRSLRELSFLYKLVNSKHNWINGEKIRIPYIDYLKKERTYSPDFIINNRVMVEIKPKKLHNTPLISLKSKAAIQYCKQHNLLFKIIDCPLLSINIMQDLIDSNNLKFQDRYLIKFKNFYKRQ